ncbi:hypothetical protein RB599_010056 [Gaeumannomyces hyphopodioides]
MGSTGVTNHPVAVPRGSLVLVTGATGFIASHVVKVFLENGYRVRGAVRNRAKAAFFSQPQSPFERYWKDGYLELVDVPDMTIPGAYRDAVRGVSVVLNVASDTGLDADPDKVIPGALATITDLLRTAAVEPSVKRFVHCSSSSALYNFPALQDDPEVVSNKSWNETALKRAYDPTTDPALRGATVYAASKVMGEKAAWEFIEQEKPGFTLNVVLPFVTLGQVLSKQHLAVNGTNFGTNSLVLNLLASDKPLPDVMKIKVCHVDAKDVAMIYLIAAIDPDVESRRLLALGEEIDWNDVLAQLRRSFPDRKWRDSVPGIDGSHGKTFEASFERSLLKKWAGRDPIPLEQSVVDVVESAT